jgi:RNA polymerase sigma factor (sigma-70 family)
VTTSAEVVLTTLFRRQSGRMMGALVRTLGVQRVDLAEDIVQETLVAALQAWRLGMPRDPEGWLYAVMRNRVRDALRRDRVRTRVISPEPIDDDAAESDSAPSQDDESGDLLRMMFSCCHPSLTDDGRTALILKLVCGFGTGEVACALLADRATMEKRLSRAKKVLADEGALFEVSTAEHARERLPAVMTALYLMFDAGYHGSATPEPMRADLCADAIRLATLLVDARATSGPDVHALIALCAFTRRACLPASMLPGLSSPFTSKTARSGTPTSSPPGCSTSARRPREASSRLITSRRGSPRSTRWPGRSARPRGPRSCASTISSLRASPRPSLRSAGRSRGPRSSDRAAESRRSSVSRRATGSSRIRSSGRPSAISPFAIVTRRARVRGSSEAPVVARNDAERAMFLRRLGECATEGSEIKDP